VDVEGPVEMSQAGLDDWKTCKAGGERKNKNKRGKGKGEGGSSCKWCVS
jgi:hypothetical protein